MAITMKPRDHQPHTTHVSGRKPIQPVTGDPDLNPCSPATLTTLMHPPVTAPLMRPLRGCRLTVRDVLRPDRDAGRTFAVHAERA